MDRIGGLSGPLVYNGSWLRALVIAVMLSWGAMQLLGLLVERRTDLLYPGTQFKSFWYGDLIFLPGIVLVIWKMSQRLPDGGGWWQSAWWHLACLTGGIVVGVIFHFVLDAAAYSPEQLVSPTKLYHDLVVYPVYIYVLVSAGFPALLYSDWGLTGVVSEMGATAMCLGMLLFLGSFVGLLAYDASHPGTKAHVPWSWSKLSKIPASNR